MRRDRQELQLDLLAQENSFMLTRRHFLKQTGSLTALAPFSLSSHAGPDGLSGQQGGDDIRAVEFESRKVYQSSQRPGYTSWVSFFPGERGQWYLTCEEVTRPAQPLARATREHWYAFGLPVGYDKSPYRMEMVILESRDQLKTWKVISRQPCRFQHSAGSFGQARTRDGRMLRFVWAVYSLSSGVNPREIFYVSEDDGKTWQKQPPFHDRHFVSYPHRLRMLRDGTLVLALPLSQAWGPGTELPVRTCMNLQAMTKIQMHLCFSFDQGRNWSSALPIFGGQNVSETDFVELASGDLLCINNSIFAYPGRQIIYRAGKRFTPGPLENALSGKVPETVCLTEQGLLVGCMRPGTYHWSDDFGQTWQRLQGIPERGPEVYQPWIQNLGDGRIACAGHYGADDPMGQRDQFLTVQLFQLEVRGGRRETQLRLVRDFDEVNQRWRNAYTLTLTSGGSALANKKIEFWFVERRKPGYDSWNKSSLEERMQMGGRVIQLVTGADGTARVSLSQLNEIEDIHHSIQLVARFNASGRDSDYKPAYTPQFEFYSNHGYQSAPLPSEKS